MTILYLWISVYFRQGDDSNKEKDIDAVLHYHQNMQEKIADDMVKMAQSLKHTSMMANNIIQQDNKVWCLRAQYNAISLWAA